MVAPRGTSNRKVASPGSIRIPGFVLFIIFAGLLLSLNGGAQRNLANYADLDTLSKLVAETTAQLEEQAGATFSSATTAIGQTTAGVVGDPVSSEEVNGALATGGSFLSRADHNSGGDADSKMLLRGRADAADTRNVAEETKPAEAAAVEEQTKPKPVSKEEFYDNGDPHSKTATVISFASGYSLDTFKNFVGSLRATGYEGNIIVGISPDTDQATLEYLEKKKVKTKILELTECSHGIVIPDDEPKLKRSFETCAKPYSDIKIRWSKYPLGRDWLKECESCTGPVLIADFRDVYFQRDPFHGVKVEGLHVFEEHPRTNTTHWLTQWPIKDCYGLNTIDKPKPMLCSGTTIGTRQAMLDYLDIMHKEMLHWVKTPQCHVKSDADDQSIHNYLVWYKDDSGLPQPLTSIPHRTGIVNTAGFEAAEIWRRNENKPSGESEFTHRVPNWLDTKLGLTDDEGFLLQLDEGTRSRVVHQTDRFGPAWNQWRNTFASEWE